MGTLIKDTAYWDRRISFYIVFYFFAEIANATIKTVLPISDALWAVLSIGWGVAIVYFMLRCIKKVWQRNSHVGSLTLGLFTMVYIISFIMILLRNEPMQAFWRGSVFVTYAYWIPIGVAASSVINKKILYDIFYKWSYPMSILLFLCVFFRRSTELMEGETEYNMFFGFHLVIPALFHITEYYKTKKKTILAFFLLEVLLLVIYANRGALIPIVFYFLFRTLLNTGTGFQKGIANIMVVSIIALLIAVFSKPLFTALNDVSEAIGIQSRTLKMISTGNITDSSGRDELATISYDMIMEKPVLGWGLGGEFYEIAKRFGGGNLTKTSASCSPHNGFLEFLVCFGVIFGMIATFVFLIPMFRIGSVRDPDTALLILIFGAAVVAPSFISADGLLIKPGAAIYAYLYYTRRHT